MPTIDTIQWNIPDFGYIQLSGRAIDATLARLRRNFRSPKAALLAIHRDTGEDYLAHRRNSATWLEVAAIATECRYYPNGA